MRRVGVISSSRADLHLMRGLIEELAASESVDLQLILTGTHLSAEFGQTDRVLDEWGIPVAARVEMLLSSDSRVGASKSLGVGVISFTDTFTALSPDIVVVMGDRYELLAPTITAVIQGIPVAHIHGGEVTKGALDDSVRHAITKMAALHFVAAEEYRKRVLQLGEEPEHVQLVGGLGVDAILRSKLLDKGEVERQLDLALGKRSILVSFHPVTLDPTPSEEQLAALLAALDQVEVTSIVFTGANADPAGRALNSLMSRFADERPHARFIHSLGDPLYASTVRAVGAVVGNSSSGLLEAPTLSTPTVNIGMRQAGRLRASSVIDCAASVDAICQAIDQALSPEFRDTLSSVSNPYGQGGASAAIAQVLERVNLEGITIKAFHDVL